MSNTSPEPGTPSLILMAGLTGAGKTTLALALGAALGWPVLDKDTLKSTLLEANLGEAIAARAAYDLLFALARDLVVRQRRSIILDSPTRFPFILEAAQAIAQEGNALLSVILCLADGAMRNQRLAQRVAMRSQPRGDRMTTVEEERAAFAHLPPQTLVLDARRSPGELIAEALTYLRRTAGG